MKKELFLIVNIANQTCPTIISKALYDITNRFWEKMNKSGNRDLKNAYFINN